MLVGVRVMAALPKWVVTAGQQRGPSEIPVARCHRLVCASRELCPSLYSYTRGLKMQGPAATLRRAERSPGGTERLSREARAALLLLDPLLKIRRPPLQGSLPPGLAFHFSAQSSPIPTGH